MWFGSRAMVWLGEQSFGFCLAQGIVLFYGRHVVEDFAQYSSPVAILVVRAYLTTNLLAGWLLFLYVERPVMRRPKSPAGGARPGARSRACHA